MQKGDVRRGGRIAGLHRADRPAEALRHGVCALVREHTVGIVLGFAPARRRRAQRLARARRVSGGAACLRLRHGLVELRAHPGQIPEIPRAQADEHEQQRACKQFLFHPSSFAAK